jgi:hypothetical protein
MAGNTYMVYNNLIYVTNRFSLYVYNWLLSFIFISHTYSKSITSHSLLLTHLWSNHNSVGIQGLQIARWVLEGS